MIFPYVDTISNNSPNLSLQNCIFQLNSLYIFNTNNVNLQKRVETFRPLFRIHQDLIESILSHLLQIVLKLIGFSWVMMNSDKFIRLK
jgi:hypothetical protein